MPFFLVQHLAKWLLFPKLLQIFPYAEQLPLLCFSEQNLYFMMTSTFEFRSHDLECFQNLLNWSILEFCVKSRRISNGCFLVPSHACPSFRAESNVKSGSRIRHCLKGLSVILLTITSLISEFRKLENSHSLLSFFSSATKLSKYCPSVYTKKVCIAEFFRGEQ